MRVVGLPLKLLPTVVIDMLHHELEADLLQLLLVLGLALFQLRERVE